ncbi:hypothetical protein D3C87_75510 [compost metagenome]
MEFKNGMTFFYLHTNTYNVNDVESLVVEMKVEERDGKLYAKAVKEGEWLSFCIEEITNYEYLKDFIFSSRQEGLAVYDSKLNKEIEELNNRSKEEMLNMFFRRWMGEHIIDDRMIDAMKSKIEREFDVEIR